MKPRYYLGLTALFFSLTLAGCDSGPDPNSSGSAVEKKKPGKVKISGKDETEGDGNGTSPDDSATGGDPTKTPTPVNPGDAAKRAAAGLAFFTDKIEPQFQINCSRCHAEPRFNPDPAGPLSIYDYVLMKAFLQDGDSKLNNKLMDKTRAQISHAGGSACGTDVTVPPCSLIMEWWTTEFGQDTGGQGLAGEIELVKFDGTVYGYAASVLEPTSQLTVDFYVGGDKGTGTKLETQTANKSGFAGGVQGAHRFQFLLPDANRNASETQLYAYAKLGGKDVPLKGSPFKFKAWKPKGNAAFYNNKFVGCGCHSRTYEGDYAQLGSPSPYEGGSPTNNKLYLTGVSGHSGGTYDTTFVRNFWNAEFGP